MRDLHILGSLGGSMAQLIKNAAHFKERPHKSIKALWD